MITVKPIHALQRLLRKAFGLTPGRDRKSDFVEFCGVWTQADEVEFEQNTGDLHKLDPRDWP